MRIRPQCWPPFLSLSGQLPGEPFNGNVEVGETATRMESGGPAEEAEARAEYASNAVAAAVARPYDEGGGRGGANDAGGWADSDGQGGYANVPPPRAAPGRPSFDGRANNGEAKKGVFRRVFRRWRD